MTTPRNFLFAFLILLTAIPQSLPAAAWMGAAMATEGMAAHAEGMAAIAGDPVHAMMTHQSADTGVGQPGMDESDCDNHCMNCTTHCFSAALAALSPQAPFQPEARVERSVGHSRTRTYLLFRPPKSAGRIHGWSTLA